MTISPFLGGFYTSRTRLLNAQRGVNIYPELVETKDGKEIGGFYGTPGLVRLATIGDGPIRGFSTMQGLLYVVSGNALYRCGDTFSPTFLGNLLTDTGPVQMCNNGSQLLIVDGVAGYGFRFESYHNVFHRVVFPFDPAAPSACIWQDGFFMVSVSGTQLFYQSAPNDVFVWADPVVPTPQYNFSVADGAPDNIVAMVDVRRELWILGSTSTEVWINAGLQGFSFQRLQGVFIQEGCAAPGSAVAAGTSLMWLGKDTHGNAIVYHTQGYQPVRVSTHAIEREIQSYARIDDAIAYYYQQEGHSFYVLTFPSADATWVYDTSTGLWHERASFVEGEFHRHRSNAYAFYADKCIVGDFEDGRIYEYDLSTYTDDGQILKRLRSWPANGTGQITLNKVLYKRLQLYAESGTGTENPPEDNPQIMLRVSNTGGQSFIPNEYWASEQRVGEVDTRIIWRRLGSGRDRVFEVSKTAATKTAWVGALVESEQGVS